MAERKNELWGSAALELLDRRWIWLVFAAWLTFCAWFLYNKWGGVITFTLVDTDDNMRMSQARALLAGQDWYDLRQHKLAGSNIHWSRLVDLPLAGLMLLLRPFLGGADAERAAVAIAPMLPYFIVLLAASLTVRRLVDRKAYALALIAFFSAGSTNGMFMPTRIDHHGWQLAMLAVSLAGMADRRRARGGATTGIASAVSLAIGLELLIYLALAGAAMVLFWIDDREQRRRLAAYAVTLSGGTALSFLLFASEANRLAVCDALSPVWLSNAMLGGALLLGLAWLSPGGWKARLALAAAAGAVVAGFHAFMWPHCLTRLEGVSPEVDRLWLSRVREARPFYTHGAQVATMIIALPLTGLVGWALLTWRNRVERDLLRRTLAVAAPAFAATVLLLWQTRTGPAAQMMGVIGAISIAWLLWPLTRRIKLPVSRVAAAVLLAVVGLGGAAPVALQAIPPKKQTKRDLAIARANRLCNTLPALRPVALLPKGNIFTFVDLGPRIITVTHHNAVTGPYHRNGEQIADVMNAFRGPPERARALVAKYRSDYVLICPNSSTTTIFMSEARDGFYAQLNAGKVPAWLTPVPLPADSPFKMWKVAR